MLKLGAERPLFLMFNDSLFNKNYQLFSKAKPDIKEVEISKAVEIRDRDYRALKKGDRWPITDSIIKSAITIPRNESNLETYRKECSSFELGKNIQQYDDIPGGDPHLLQNILALYDFTEKLGIDPKKTNTSFKELTPYCLYVLATGSGIELRDYIIKMKPYKLVIAVTDWVDLISSFWHIDWQEILKSYPTKDIKGTERAVLFTRDIDGSNHLSQLNTIGISLLDHSLVYYPTTEEKRLEKPITELTGPILRSTIHYLGFILDEYNMILNTAGTLPLCKKLFSKKITIQPHSNAIVCGSGPSLDESLDDIKKLSQDHTILACASNFASLLKAGIRVDILVLLERGLNNYINYKDILEEFPSPDTILFCSTTCAPKLQTLFRRSVAYYRPALMPTTLFSPTIDHVLHYEGPQTTNAGIAIAASLEYENIALFGIDLGTSDQRKLRSRDALGVSPRSFEIETKGNKCDIAYTNRGLEDSKGVKEACIKKYHKSKFFNFSSGIYISGATPINIEDYREMVKERNVNITSQTSQIYRSFPNASIASVSCDWESSRFQIESFSLLARIKKVIQASVPLYPDTMFALEDLFRLNVPLREQTPKKLYRSAFLKLAMAIRNQSIVIASNSDREQAEKFEAYGRGLLLRLQEALTSELFDLSSRVDSLLNNE